MCSKEVRCKHPCYKCKNGKLLLRVAPDTTGEIETKCNKPKKCTVVYDATADKLICKPNK